MTAREEAENYLRKHGGKTYAYEARDGSVFVVDSNGILCDDLPHGWKLDELRIYGRSAEERRRQQLAQDRVARSAEDRRLRHMGPCFDRRDIEYLEEALIVCESESVGPPREWFRSMRRRMRQIGNNQPQGAG